MKIYLVLSFYLVTFALVSGRILNETASFPRSRAISIQSQSPKILLLRPQAREEQKIEKIIYLKQLLELKCLKKIFSDIRNKNRLRYLQPYRMIKPWESSPYKNLQHQILQHQIFHKMRPNLLHVESQSRNTFGNNRIIFLPYKGKFVERKTHKFQQNKTSQSNASEVVSNRKLENFNEKKQNTKYKNIKISQTPPLVDDRRKNEEKFARENSRVFTLNEDIPKADIPKADTLNSFPKIYRKPSNVKLILPTYSVESYILQQDTKPIRPYEVTEPVGEEGISSFFDKKNNDGFKNRQLDGKTYLGSSFLGREPGRKTDNLNSHSVKADVNDGINTVLRTLAESVDLSEKKSKEIFYNLPSHNGYLESVSNKANSNSDNGFADFSKKTIESKPAVIPQQQSKQLKIMPPNFYEMIRNSRERSTKTTAGSEIETNFATTVKVENVRNVSVTKFTNLSSDVLKTKKWSDLVENSQKTTTAPEIQTSSEFFDGFRDLDVQNVLIENQESSTLFTVTETTIKNFTAHEKTVTDNENSSTSLFTLSKSQTTPTEQTTNEFLSAKSSNVDSSNKVTKNPEIIENAKNMEMETNFPEEGPIMPIFTEITDHPLTVDLLTTLKKEQETVLKNSRKMHFNQEILTTTMSNQVSQFGNSEQRRSDILIDENLDDYFLYDNGFTLNYIKQLKQKNFLNKNSTSDFIIQLIPFVINDLREDRIFPEDIPILSKAFGDYWTAVLALSNSTNLDMLPLLKMKNEKDLKNFLNTFFPGSLISTEFKETDSDNYLGYYYEDEYSDLSENQGELEEKEGGFRFKRDENSGYFESVKEEKRNK